MSTPPEIGDRLREERERLGMSQDGLGAVGGVTGRAQRNYERGDRELGVGYLAAIAVAGVDVLYVVTGKRSTSVKAVQISAREQTLLNNYEASSQEVKRAIDKMALLGANERTATRDGAIHSVGRDPKKAA